MSDGAHRLETIYEVKPSSFIFVKENALAHGLCNEIITRFEANDSAHHQGYVGEKQVANTDLKRSTDLFISGKQQWRDVDGQLFRSLADALREFAGSFPYFRGKFKDAGYGIQRTCAGEFYHWHIDGDSRSFSERQLVAIWYLNDVGGPGGETEFLFQDVRIKPSEGKLLLFPPFWTHQHRGVRLEAGVKYIATTWIIFQ